LSSALQNVQPTDINISDVINLQTTLDGKQIKITDNDYLSISDVSGLSSALQNVQPTDINISDVINLQTTLDGKQTKITDNDYLSISDVSGLSSALQNVQPTDINISDVINLQVELNKKQETLNAFDNILIDESNNIYLFDVVTNENLQTALENVQTKISDNNYISISDVSGLSSALQNVQPTDINISDVINLQTRLDTKQDVITKNDNFIIDSMYVTPLGNKTTVNPAQTGELRASILKVEHNSLGLIDVAESINTLTTSVNEKQAEILSTSNLTLGTLDANGLITCGDLTINGEGIQTLVDNASGSGLTKSDIDGKQDILTAGNNITINTTTDTTTNITTNTISATSEVTQANLNTKQDNLSATSLLTIATLNVMSELGVSTISNNPGEITCDSLIVGGNDINTLIDSKIANSSTSTDFDAFNVTVTYSVFFRTTDFRSIRMFTTSRVNIKSNFTNNQVFTATIPGTHFFSLTVYSEVGFTATVQIRKNNVIFESMFIPNDSIKIKYTMTTIIDLVAGDQVNSYSFGGFNMQPNETVFYGYLMNAAQVESSFVS
jgi:hypothetical protein